MTLSLDPRSWVRALWERPPVTIIDDHPSQLGLAAVEIARSEVGHGEESHNNVGPALDRYRRGGPGGPWCAAFVSYCLDEAARRIGLHACPVKRSHNAKRLFANAVAVGTRMQRPAEGALVLWHRGAAGARTGHIGIVGRVEGNAFWSIEGNRGGYPSRVRAYQHEVGEALLLGFARMP